MEKKVESVGETKVRKTTVRRSSSVEKKFSQTSNVAEDSKTKINDKKSNSATKDDTNFVKKDFVQKLESFIEEKVKAGDQDYKKQVEISKMNEAGIQVGLSRNLWNPKMRPYIYNIKSKKRLFIDVSKTIVYLNKACTFLSDMAKDNAKILFVGTKGDIIKKTIAEEAQRVGCFYINQRWLGGTLTNFKTISRSISKLNKMIDLLNSEEINKYPKHEQIKMRKEVDKKTKFIGGIRNMNGLPNVIVVIDPIVEHNAINEARQLKIPVISLANTNANPNVIDFIIPCNTKWQKSVWLMISILADAIAQAKGLETKVVGKPNEEIILPEEPTKKPRKIVNIA